MLGAALIFALVRQDLPTPPPAPKAEFRGVWVATVDNIDWPSKRGIPTEQAKAELIKILNKCRELNLNAVIFQVRPSADALYESKIEPWSEYLTGLQGASPAPYWDPLAFAITEAHKRGLELHCWFNPYRALHPSQKGPLAASHIAMTNPSIVKQYGKFLWMDPGEPAVQKRSLEVMIDVVKRYDIDGVHIDDYFYPYKVKGPDGNDVDFPDAASFARYGGKLSRDDWRRKNVDDFIERLYREIKKTKRWVKFGISPFGIYRPGVPEGIKAGVDQYADLYADALKWYREGWCDYFTPQLYWPVKQTPQAYPVLLKWWAENNPSKRHLWPGNFTSRTDPGNGNWPAQELVDQIKLTRSQKGAGGNVHFSVKALMADNNRISTTLKSGLYKDPAFVPTSPWLGEKKPGTPELYLNRTGFTSEAGVAPVKVKRNWRLEWRMAEPTEAEFYAVAFGREVDGTVVWSKWRISSEPLTQIVQDSTEPNRFAAILAVSRTGVVSDPVVVTRPR